MPNYLLMHKDQELGEKYGDYCLKAILSGEGGKAVRRVPARGDSMTHKCKSGQHTWIFKEDAEKCCNGFRRVLVFNDPKSCDNVVLDLLPGGVSYGYRWEPV